MPKNHSPVAKLAFKFVLIIGIVNLFADMTYEGARSITGPFLESLGQPTSICIVGPAVPFSFNNANGSANPARVVRKYSCPCIHYVLDQSGRYFHASWGSGLTFGVSLQVLFPPPLKVSLFENWRMVLWDIFSESFPLILSEINRQAE